LGSSPTIYAKLCVILIGYYFNNKMFDRDDV